MSIDWDEAKAAGSATEDPWDQPVPLGRQVALPPFPLDALPPWLARFVDELAVALQTPRDLPGVLALVALATAAGGRAVVEVRPGWREPLNLFAAVAMAPGSRKSGVFARITEPLNVAEREAIAGAKPLVVEASTRRKAAQSAADQAAAIAGKSDPDKRDDAVSRAVAAAEMAEAVTVPAMPRLLADDATPEALASLLVEQRGRIALLSPEGDVFEMMAGRYSKTGPSLGVYLKGHAGDAMRCDRKGRAPEHVRCAGADRGSGRSARRALHPGRPAGLSRPGAPGTVPLQPPGEQRRPS